MAITDLTNTKWVINETPDISSASELFNLTFNSNGNSYTEFNLGVFDRPNQAFQLVYTNNIDTIVCDTNNGWSNQAYRIIEITGGTDVTNSSLIQWLEANATQVQVTDLTGTKWVIKESPDVLTTTNFNCSINFTSNNENFTTIENPSGLEELNYIGSSNYTVYDGIENEWSNQAYRIISITGGNDVSNPDLLIWLSQNATQVPVVDLSNTTWTINSITCPAAYGQFSVDFSILSQSIDEQAAIYIGYAFDRPNHPIATANSIYCLGSLTYLYVDDELEFTGGTDIANPDLIAWLSQNATYQEPTPTKTFDLSTLQLSAGTHTVQVKARGQGYRDSNFSNSVTYNVPQKYSGNIETYSGFGMADTKIKFDTPPQSENDYDSATWSGFSDIYGLTSYQNKTKIYIWSGLNYGIDGKVKINNIETNGGTTYDTAVELDLTGDYTIYLYVGLIA